MNVRRCIMAGTAAIGLIVAAPNQSRADISFGDLNNAFDNFGQNWIEQVLDSLCAWLLMPSTPPAIAVAAPLPTPMVGGYPDAIPNSPTQGITVANEIIADQRARVAAAEEIIGLAATATATNSTQLAALSTANMAAPVSVAAQIAIGNQAEIAGASASATTSQMMAAEAAMRSAQIMREEHARAIAVAQAEDFASYGRTYTVAAENIQLARP
jgi:hypothetical protein